MSSAYAFAQSLYDLDNIKTKPTAENQEYKELLLNTTNNNIEEDLIATFKPVFKHNFCTIL